MKKTKDTGFRILSITLISGLIILMNSCLDPQWDFEKFSDEIILTPGVAAPIAYGSLSLDELLNELDSSGYVKIFDDSLLYISYANRLFSHPANEVVDIPNQNFLEFFIESDIALSPEWIGASPEDTIMFHKDKAGVFNFQNNEKIDSFHVKTMDLVINVQSSFEHSGVLTISSDSILINGEAFREVVQISDASGNFSYSKTLSLDEHSIYLDNTDPDNTVLPLSFDLALINSGNPILPGQSLDITMTFIDPEFHSVFGYLGDYELMMSNDVVVIDIFDTDSLAGGGSIFFADPRFNLDVANSYGIPVEVNISQLEAYSKINDQTTQVVFEPGVNPFSIAAPGLDAVGDTVNTPIAINKETSNIDEVMKTFPRDFIYTVSAATNPGSDGTANNFVTDTSDFIVDFEVILPIWIKAEGFEMEDTLSFDFEDRFGESTNIIDYLRFTLDAANGLPMEINMQVYFLDENYTVLDSLYEEDSFLLPATLNESFMVEDRVEQSKSAEFTKEKIDAIKPSKYLRVKASSTTAGAETDNYVKFYSYYTVDFKLKMKADLTINSREQ